MSTLIPNPRTARDALSVTDGSHTVGFLISRDGSYFAFNNDRVLLGEYKSRTEALQAIPPSICSSTSEKK
jgi:hypothetical protein